MLRVWNASRSPYGGLAGLDCFGGKEKKMKYGKRLVALVALVVVVATSQLVGLEFYSNLANGYSGLAGAEYYGTTAERSLKEWHQHSLSVWKHQGDLFLILEGPKKLTNEVNWLIWQALGEYNYRDGEVYKVLLAIDRIEALVVTVSIADNGNSINWHANTVRAK